MRGFWLYSTWLSLLAGCADADLYRLEMQTTPKPPVMTAPPTITVKGTYCAASAEQLISPVKILFVIDDSTSMNLSDGGYNRLKAAQQLIAGLFDTSEHIYFGVERFSGGATSVLTNPAFVHDRAQLDNALSQAVHMNTPGTPYLDALRQARSAIEIDMAGADREQLARTRYVLLYLSDGEPTDTGQDQILAEEDLLLALRGGNPPVVGDITVHTAYLQDGAMPNQRAIDLLSEMARKGNGEFRNFRNGESIDFRDFDVTALSRDYLVLSRVLVTNQSAILREQGVVADSDLDGLSDAREQEVGTDPLKKDTDGDGCGDLLEVNYEGYKPLEGGGHCRCTSAERDTDSDGDGLSDCEEMKLVIDPKNPDSDVDGQGNAAPDYLIDSLEVAWKMARKNPDAGSDYDGDGVSNYDEIKTHMDPQRQDTSLRADFAYTYEYDNEASVGRSCFDVLVRNIHVAPTQAADGRAAGDNVIQILFADAPQDNPLPERAYKVLRLVIHTQNGQPSPSVLEFKPEDFQPLK